MFQYLKDNFIKIDNNFKCTVEEFAQLEPKANFDGIDEIYYDDVKKYQIINGNQIGYYNTNIDTYIANKENYIQTLKELNAPPPLTLEEVKQDKIQKLKYLRKSVEEELLSTIQIHYLGTIYHADDNALLQLTKVNDAIELSIQRLLDTDITETNIQRYQNVLNKLLPLPSEDESTPNVRRYWTDIYKNPTILSKDQLAHLTNKVKEIHKLNVSETGELIYQNYFQLYTAIKACNTVEQVNEINFASLDNLKSRIIDVTDNEV